MRTVSPKLFRRRSVEMEVSTRLNPDCISYQRRLCNLIMTYLDQTITTTRYEGALCTLRPPSTQATKASRVEWRLVPGPDTQVSTNGSDNPNVTTMVCYVTETTDKAGILYTQSVLESSTNVLRAFLDVEHLFILDSTISCCDSSSVVTEFMSSH